MIAKVCGITSGEDAERVLALGADLLGFLHHPASPRHCRDLALARLAGEKAVLVTVAEDGPEVLARLGQGCFTWVQPHLPRAGRAGALALLKARGFRVLLPWPDEADQEPLEADLYLWESSPRSTGLPGGSGRSHGMAHPPPGPFLLAGGLRGADLAPRLEAMPCHARPFCRGFDAASRLESPGVPGKDPGLARAFVDAAHSLECVPWSES